MKDLNFFLTYTETEKESKSTNYIIFGMIGLVALFIVASTIWYGASSLLLNNKISSLKDQISDTNLQSQYIKSEAVVNKNTILKKYDNEAGTIKSSIDNANLVSSEFLYKLNAQLPQDVFISSISISGTSLNIACAASSRAGIAEFEHNLLSLENISYVNITDINGDANKKSYTFTAKCTIKGVDKNENK